MNESPDVLYGGTWVRAGLVFRWVPVEPPTPDQRDPSTLIACPTCHARLDQSCRSANGRKRLPHATRLVSRRCPCGDLLPRPCATYCGPCAHDHVRVSQRDYRARAAKEAS